LILEKLPEIKHRIMIVERPRLKNGLSQVTSEVFVFRYGYLDFDSPLFWCKWIDLILIKIEKGQPQYKVVGLHGFRVFISSA